MHSVNNAFGTYLWLHRGWHSCDPYELFAAPIIKQTKNDPNQKKIEKTLQIEARKAQVRCGFTGAQYIG